MPKISSSAPPPKTELLETKEKKSPKAWAKVWGRFITGMGKQAVKSCMPELLKNMKNGTKINKRSIEHLTLTNKRLGDVMALNKAQECEKEGKFIQANWLRAKANENFFADPEEPQIQHFGALGKGGEGRADLVFKGLAAPLEVKKTLYNGNSKESKAEMALLSRLDHPNIIKASPGEKGESSEEGIHFLKNGGHSLTKLVPTKENRAPISRPLFVSVAKQMASALDYLRKEQVLHRDIKPDNIVIDPTGKISLIDFGMAYDGHTKTSCNPLGIGTLIYMEPDTTHYFNRITNSRTGDMFATGQTLFQLITGAPIKFPEFYGGQGMDYGNRFASWKNYKDGLEAPQYIARQVGEALKGESPKYVEQVTELLTRMLEPDPDLRITPAELKKHPLLNDNPSQGRRKPKKKKLPPLRRPLPPRPMH